MENNFNRAKQFAPFDSLRGFRTLLEEKEKIKDLKKNLSEDEYEELSNKIKEIKKGNNIELIYYSNKEYIKINGLVSNIDFIYKFLVIGNIKINFNNIYKIYI
ncbi:MAG: YolD-like family protein [Tenericutes bacterium]|nr:YolD-like family protein [Bacilli bacterium]NLV90645.1 YolD-like family protein [Mycoplasmatota bacterium]